MRINFTIDDAHVEELVTEACEEIVNKYAPYNLEDTIRKKINVDANEIINTVMKDSNLQDYIKEKVNDTVYGTIDAVLRKERNYKARAEVGAAIRDVIYGEKDKIIEEVTNRATEEITRKASTRLFKKMMEEMQA